MSKKDDRTLPHSRFSSQDEAPLVVLLEPVVYFLENVRSTCEVFCELLNVGEGDRF
ncbi:hypothetical protein [Phormidium tenue]|uniref:hypothetical protein n=1 Tax=Phormidium tenue TaxID=126344 RepID=UPI0015C52986|nr:hypothetical protein [Phormidium tenue]MBD2234622.1 hypothetical protein [Phormidium tenue FACHB-1052]